MQKFKEYYSTNEFASIANLSTKTLTRLKKELIAENPNTLKVKRINGNGNEYHHSLLKRYISPEIFDILLSNKSLRNTISCLKRENTIEHYLFHMPWTFFGTVAYKNELSEDLCFDTMSKVYNTIENIYGDKTIIRMFFTTESFTSAEGNHNHFVLYISNNKLAPKIEMDIKTMLDGNRIHLDSYDDQRPCIFYSGKEGLKGVNWDILGNNLSKDGVEF